jgi:hypothetical protein
MPFLYARLLLSLATWQDTRHLGEQELVRSNCFVWFVGVIKIYDTRTDCMHSDLKVIKIYFMKTKKY